MLLLPLVLFSVTWASKDAVLALLLVERMADVQSMRQSRFEIIDLAKVSIVAPPVNEPLRNPVWADEIVQILGSRQFQQLLIVQEWNYVFLHEDAADFYKRALKRIGKEPYKTVCTDVNAFEKAIEAEICYRDFLYGEVDFKAAS